MKDEDLNNLFEINSKDDYIKYTVGTIITIGLLFAWYIFTFASFTI